MNIQAGGLVQTNGCTLGAWNFSTGTATLGNVTVAGTGSYWSDSNSIYVSYGTLDIQAGGQVSTGYASVGGTAKVTGAGSIWASIASWAISGNFTVSGKLTVADGGDVTATSMTVNPGQSVVELDVSGNNMLVLGTSTTAGSITNNGTINIYANAFLAPGTYSPIAEHAGRPMTWSGTGYFNASGGTWDSSAHTFTVAAPTALAAGATTCVSSGQRLLLTDSGSKKVVGATFGDISGSPTFSATVISDTELNALTSTKGFSGTVLSGWNFTTTLSGNEVMLAFNVGKGAQALALWHYDGTTWTPYTTDSLTYDSNGIASFTVTSFSDYAVAAVPEPATMAILALGGLALIRRRR